MRNWTPTRPVPFWRLFLRGWGWITVLAVPAFLILSGIVLHAGYHMARLSLDGVVAEARIEGKLVQDADGDSRTDDREVHSLRFSFIADGAEVTDTMRVSEDFWNSVKRQDIVALRYSASDPRISEIEPGALAGDARLGLIALAVLFATAGPILWRQWLRARDQVRVRDHGQARTAIVISHQNTGVQVNDKSAYRLHWRDETGATGRTTAVNRLALRRFPVGSEITLYIDPSGDRPPIWEGEVGPPRRDR